ncbi:helix-turn-helix transcriptional regulator [Sphingosinicella sp. LY1275]|uniref:helix-turn-helix domain-containing protein n=1 Tax=Sphingosinicella sp. LY1275 TaxID=3095379 RepID=UPI002ADEA8B2|nr:helix-turn-helix transcriptional regulator [Sphingosinicella sp. LY1275]MEA1013953.1 helix-turn-helix transcriptional regulator [Sphingosinicella sp. LY1275]
MGGKRAGTVKIAGARRRPPPAGGRDVRIDRYKTIVFPNNLRALRKRAGYPKLLALAEALPDIPYIRLSKIERGEVFAKAEELVRIAAALRVAPSDLLVDIGDPAFDLPAWAAEIHDDRSFDRDAETFAALLGAALRHRRTSDAALTIAALDKDYGIPPVILSRIENAHKTLDRWNDATVAALCRIFDVANVAGLRERVRALHAAGALNALLDGISNPQLRIAKTRARVAELRAQLAGAAPAEAPAAPAAIAEPAVPAVDVAGTARLLPVFGAPLADGLIAKAATGASVEAPRTAGPRAYGLRVCRPSLGGGLPGSATIVVDPERFPSSGGLAVVREVDGLRLLSVTFDRNGAMKGYSQVPDREVALDALDPADVAAVIAAYFE